jgi:2,3-dihydroxyphenylpropionate 1,2-dioxygenase
VRIEGAPLHRKHGRGGPPDNRRREPMGRIVYAAAMSHVLFPDYYGKNVGPPGRQMVEELIGVVREMGRELTAARPDALVVIADDHLNVFSFDAVPALCVRIGRSVSRMAQEGAIEFDQALDGLPERYPIHEDLANHILEQGLEAGFDFAASWSAPLDHAFLSPVMTLCGDRPVPPLVPFWVNCFVAPQPTARRCFAAGQHIARVVAAGPWRVAAIATGGLSHFPELSLARVGQSDVAFDRRLVGWMEAGDHEPLCALSVKELHATGSHEFLNWMVLIGAVSPAPARVRFFGEMGRIDLAAVEWPLG